MHTFLNPRLVLQSEQGMKALCLLFGKGYSFQNQKELGSSQLPSSLSPPRTEMQGSLARRS